MVDHWFLKGAAALADLRSSPHKLESLFSALADPVPGESEGEGPGLNGLSTPL